MTQKIYMTLEIAKYLVEGAQLAAHSKNITLVVSIYDNHGNLKAYERMDDTSFGSIRVSQLKGLTSASFPVSTGDLCQRSSKLPSNPYGSIPDILLLGGGLPVFCPDGNHIGSIGISGATPEMDTYCAEHAIEYLYTKMGWLTYSNVTDN